MTRTGIDRILALPAGRRIRVAVGLAALFSGAALLTNILGGISLALAVIVAFGMVVLGLAVPIRRAEAADRRRLVRIALCGAAAGLLATLVYDAAKFGLSQLDPSPYNPFEATRIFGTLLVGRSAPEAAIQVAGTGFHLLNGTTFGLAYAFLFSRDGRTSWRYAALSGMAWGLFLETFQLTLYPGWLDIRFYDEFVRISALSHLVYGATLGALARLSLRSRYGPAGPASHGSPNT